MRLGIAVCAGLGLLVSPALAQSGGPASGGRAPATLSAPAPVPAVPPPTTGPATPSYLTPTNPPDRLEPPGRSGDTPFSGPPGVPNGGLAGSDRVNPPSGGAGTPPAGR